MFRGLLLTVLGSQTDFHDCRTPRCAYVSVIHTRGFWPILSRFMDYYSVLGSQSDFHGCRTLGCVYLSVVNTQFLQILVRFLDYYSPFSGPEVICMTNEPRGAFTCRSSTLVVLADSGPFRGLLHCFGGPGVISTIEEPRGAFTCRSSTPVVLADSGPFRGLLLTVLRSRADFHD